MRSEVTFDRLKFQELLLYIAEQTADDERFGDTKLHKTLYFADFRAYNELGRAITGASYEREELGPMAAQLADVRDEMKAAGLVDVKEEDLGEKKLRTTVGHRQPDTSLFSDAELAIVDRVIEMLRPLTSVEASELAHERSAGWHLVNDHEEIPYSTALIETKRPPEATFERARALATRYGW